MSEDVSSEVAGLISGAKVFGGSDNIRHGHYKFLIKRIFAQLVETDHGKNKMAFWELTPLESAPNPQIEGDRVDYVSPQQPGSGPLKDDGNKPNIVGSNCALKVNFDGPGARSAGANIKGAILGLFGKRDGEISDEEINKTWRDLSRERDLNVGDAIGVDSNNKPIFAQVAKRANWACGMIIYCSTMTKKKKTANEKGMYVTRLLWDCKGNPPGVGENAWELVEKRRAEIEAARVEEEEEEAPSQPSAPASTPSPYGQPAPQTAAPQPPAPPPPAPPAPPTVEFVPPKPWMVHPTAERGPTPDKRWYHDGLGNVKNEAQLRTGA